MNEYVITFVNELGVYQELTFRGVSETVATALASGLDREPFQAVTLQARSLTSVPIPLGGIPLPDVAPLPDVPAVEEPPVDGGDTGPAEPVASRRKK